MKWMDYRKQLGLSINCKTKMSLFRQEMLNVFNLYKDWPYSSKEYIFFCNKLGLPFDYDECTETLEDATGWLDNYYEIEFVFAVVVLVNSIDNKTNKKRIINVIKVSCKNNGIAIDVLNDADGVFIFPKGAKELDDALVSEPLEWLNNYPQTRKEWIEALKDYSNLTDANASAVADKFRKALERFFQEFFSSTKSLENLKSEYGSFMKSKGVPAEISNNFETLQLSYTNFMNNYAKHHDKTSKNVLEYIMYQTGNIIRLLITLDSEGN